MSKFFLGETLISQLRSCTIRKIILVMHSGCPRLLQYDRGRENTLISFSLHFTIDSMSGIRSFQYGNSTANQVGACITLPR